LSLPYARYSKPNQRVAFYRRILQQINVLPGVQAVGAVSTIPLSGAEFNDTITIEGRPLPQSVQESPIACVTVISPDYFRVMGIPLLKGRPFNPNDNRNAPRVAIINETFARRFFPEEDPLGKRIQLFADSESGETWFSIVGVVRDVKHTA